MLRKHPQPGHGGSNLKGQYNIIEGSIHTEHLLVCRNNYGEICEQKIFTKELLPTSEGRKKKE